MRKSDYPVRNWPLRFLAIALSVTMALWIITFLTEGGIRSTTDRFNVASAGTGDFWVPIIVLGIVLITPFSRAKGWAVAGLVPTIAFSCFCHFMARVWPITDPPQCVQTILAGRFPVRVFRWPGWDDGPIIVQQEFPLSPGLVWVRPLVTENADSFTTTGDDKHHLTIHFSNSTNDRQPVPRDITVYVYQ